MSVGEKPSEVVRWVRAHRICTDDPASPLTAEDVGVVAETPVTIDVWGVGSYTTLCTPTDRLAMALGFLLTEGIIDSKADVSDVRPCSGDENIMRVRLTRRPSGAGERKSSRLIVSSCGLCGSENIDGKLRGLPVVGDTLRIGAETLRTVSGALRGNQPLFEASGATHAAEIFDESGKILFCAEDAGRHNALDKVIGKCMLHDVPSAGRGVMLSSRVSVEIVGKCAKAGIELIGAVSAPTTLALDVASRCDITLCSFVRETRATVFTHPRRVTGIS